MPPPGLQHARRRLSGSVWVFAALLVFVTATARADDKQPVDLHLVLAVDASGSVNESRFTLQKQGYVAAFRNPRVLAAIRSGGAQAIAVTVVQWTGPSMQVQSVPWTRIGDAASIEAFARAIDRAPRQLFGGGTSISGAIDHAMTLFPASPFGDSRRVIDISGDGANNRGRPATEARDAAIAEDVTINGLPILELDPFLDEFYRRNVIGGPNAFLIAAATFEEFGDAILKKLVLEIAGRALMPLKVRQTSQQR